MNQPTEEQIKEFWEWCGFTILLEGMCLYPRDKGVSGRVKPLPPIDLNSLFLYAIPKIKSEFPNWKSVLHDWVEGLSGNYYDALVLFWAVWKVKEGGDR